MYILDTNAVSELRKVARKKADPAFTSWARGTWQPDLYLSVITVEELEIGALLVARKDRSQGQMLRQWLESQLLRSFEGRILPVDLAIARRAAALHVPDPRPVRDALIAATALVHRMTIVTRNVRDFESTGVSLLNPWERRTRHA